MGHQANVRLLRRQMRHIAEEKLPEVIKEESLQALMKRLEEENAKHMEEIGKSVDTQVKTLDSQTQTFRKYVMQEVDLRMGHEFTNILALVSAAQEIVAEKLGMNVTEFTALLEERKAQVLHRLSEDARKREEEAAAAAKVKAEAEKPAASEDGPDWTAKTVDVPADQAALVPNAVEEK